MTKRAPNRSREDIIELAEEYIKENSDGDFEFPVYLIIAKFPGIGRPFIIKGFSNERLLIENSYYAGSCENEYNLPLRIEQEINPDDYEPYELNFGAKGSRTILRGFKYSPGCVDEKGWQAVYLSRAQKQFNCTLECIFTGKIRANSYKEVAEKWDRGFREYLLSIGEHCGGY